MNQSSDPQTPPLIFLGIMEAVLVAILAYVLSSWMNRKRIPSQYRLPPLAPNSFLDSLKATTRGSFHWFLLSVTRNMGKICRLTFVVPGKIIFVSSDVELNRQILVDQETTKSPTLKNFNKITAGTTQFFTSNGYRFYHARKAMAPAFANNHIKRMDKVTMDKTEKWIQNRLQGFAERREEIDINKEMVDLTLSVILEAAFEYDMSPEEQERLMDCVYVTLKTFVFPNPFKMAVWFLFPSIWQAHQKARELMQIAKNIMEDYRRNEATKSKGTVIDMIMNNRNYNNDDERAADVVDIIIAGHETSANSMTFLLLELSRNQKEQQRLRKELVELSPEDRYNCNQLKNCIKEGLRLWPVTAVGPVRVVGRDFVVAASNEPGISSSKVKDFFLPKGTLVFMPSIGISRNPIYFDRPEEFVPTRWENPSAVSSRALFPFSLGKRSCLGQSLANSEMQSILARVLEQYEFSVAKEGTTRYFITLKPEGVRLTARKL
jgi:cytochrome P450